MLKGIFRNRKAEPTKVETWKKFELFELFQDLDKAERILSELSGGYSGNFIDATEFHKEFVKNRQNLDQLIPLHLVYTSYPQYGAVSAVKLNLYNLNLFSTALIGH